VLIVNNTFAHFDDYVAVRINGDFPPSTPVNVASNIFYNNRHHYWGNASYTHDNLAYDSLNAPCNNDNSPVGCGGSIPPNSIVADPGNSLKP